MLFGTASRAASGLTLKTGAFFCGLITFPVFVTVVATLVSVPAYASDPTLADAQRAFFNARYQTAADLALALQTSDAEALAAYEVRTSALHFQLRDALGNDSDKGKALKACSTCAVLLKAFLIDTAKGQALARAQLKIDPLDDDALFFLGKLNLNYVWLHVETLGRKTGWGEYWEARRSLDAALKDNPQHMRARVARAWVDYIVGTKMTRGTRWVLGGGSKKPRARRRSQSRGSRVGLLYPRRSRIRALGNAGARSAARRSDHDSAKARERLPGEPQAGQFPEDRVEPSPMNRRVTHTGCAIRYSAKGAGGGILSHVHISTVPLVLAAPPVSGQFVQRVQLLD